MFLTLHFLWQAELTSLQAEQQDYKQQKGAGAATVAELKSKSGGKKEWTQDEYVARSKQQQDEYVARSKPLPVALIFHCAALILPRGTYSHAHRAQ